MAETGLQLAAQISQTVYGYQTCQLVIAKAWGALGGTFRAINRFDEAEWSYRTAACYLRWAAAGKVEKAELCRRLAFLRRDQGKFRESRRLLTLAIEFYRSEHQTSLLGQAFADMGRVLLTESEDPRTTERYLLRALDCLSEEDEAYVLSVRFSLLALYCEHGGGLGEPQALLELVQEIKTHPMFTEGSALQADVLRLEGLALNRAGRPTEAIRILGRARDLFLCHENGLHVAITSMELAMIWLQLGSYEECQRLAGELFPIYKSLKKDREAAAALALFIKSATDGQLDAAVTRQALARLQTQVKNS